LLTFISRTGHEKSLPDASDALLVVEVSGTTLDYDRGVKLHHYAKARIPEIWVVDLKRALVSVHRKPGDSGYAETLEVRKGGLLEPSQLSGLRVQVDDVLV
jgi:Uma2 family endonuclease